MLKTLRTCCFTS